MAGLQEADLICLTNLRWDSLRQRTHHLMTRHAPRRRVYFVEPSRVSSDSESRSTVERVAANLSVVVPWLPAVATPQTAMRQQREVLEGLLESEDIQQPILWYETPLPLASSKHVSASLVVYDCRDALAQTKSLLEREAELLRRAHVVFAGGASLHDVKKHLHHNVHAVPSGVDVAHFAAARREQPDPHDQAGIPHPRLGFFGAIDERVDVELLESISDARPDWHVVLLGPLARLDGSVLRRRPNVHLLGAKPYAELPAYAAGWDVALLPFVRSAATQHLNPAQTLEYLAAGRPVVSAPLEDVMRPYAEAGVVRIADGPRAWAAAIESAMPDRGDSNWLAAVAALLADTSWDHTFDRVEQLMEAARAETIARASQAAGAAASERPAPILFARGGGVGTAAPATR